MVEALRNSQQLNHCVRFMLKYLQYNYQNRDSQASPV